MHANTYAKSFRSSVSHILFLYLEPTAHSPSKLPELLQSVASDHLQTKSAI